MTSRLFRLFLIFSLHFVYVFGDGNIIVLYGTSCVGKSTLAKKLVKELPEDYVIIKKSAEVVERRKDLIERITGKRPKNHREMVETRLSLPKQTQKEAHNITIEVTKQTIQKIKKMAKNGNNIIFDICINNPEPLKALEGCNLTTILVYAPISQISKREQERALSHHNGKVWQQQSRRVILSSLHHLYKPTSDDDDHYLDTISYQEVMDFYNVAKDDKLNPDLPKAVKRTLNHFGLTRKSRVKMVPQTKHDLLINTGKLDVDECANTRLSREPKKRKRGQAWHSSI